MINVNYEFDLSVLDGLFARKRKKIYTSLEKAMNQISLELATKIVQDKLHGQVLKQRTGILAGSVHANPTKLEGTNLVGEVVSSEGPAWYGIVHEEGGRRWYDIDPVNKKWLYFMINGKEVFAKHVHHPPAKVRSFMRSTMDEQAENIARALSVAVTEAAE